MWWIVCGTRPEIVKLEPVFKALRAPFRVICTDQHTDLLQSFRLPTNTVHLGLPSANDPLEYVQNAQNALQRLPEKPLGVIVQGDTASALAGARFAKANRLELAHVEAGLRTYQHDPWPEETFRVEIDRLATIRFPATEGNLCNLLAEGLVRNNHVVGNTVVDALRGHTRDVSREGILLTLHRRESFGAPMREIVSAVEQSGQKVTWPVHPNPEVQKVARATSLTTCLPLNRLAFLSCMKHSKAVVTDSGGVIEEAATLGIPCVIAREHTERMEAVESGIAVLSGRSKEGVAEGLKWALRTQIEPSQCFGTGNTALQIARLLPELQEVAVV